ncbi:MAG: hypothetical protein IJM58_06705 [Muribaculaceae bacterium]|nr:hypothetical protein [Muribaculaceae bacterium]
MKAWIDNKKGVGYVVMWSDGYTHTPLRNFGQMLSAAFEFRNWLNTCTDERLPRWIKTYSSTYDPQVKYTYPEFNNNRPTLRRQKGE